MNERDHDPAGVFGRLSEIQRASDRAGLRPQRAPGRARDDLRLPREKLFRLHRSGRRGAIHRGRPPRRRRHPFSRPRRLHAQFKAPGTAIILSSLVSLNVKRRFAFKRRRKSVDAVFHLRETGSKVLLRRGLAGTKHEIQRLGEFTSPSLYFASAAARELIKWMEAQRTSIQVFFTSARLR